VKEPIRLLSVYSKAHKTQQAKKKSNLLFCSIVTVF